MSAKNITAELQGASQADTTIVTKAKLTQKQRYVMRFMVTNEKNFESNDTVYGKIMPNVVYTFNYKKQNVFVAVDFGLRKWQIQDENGKDYNITGYYTMQFFSGLFIDLIVYKIGRAHV